MLQDITFFHSINFDLIFSLVRLCDDKPPEEFVSVYSEELMDKFKSDDSLSKWLKKTTVPEQQQNRINSFFNSELRLQTLLIYSVRFKELATPQQLIDYINDPQTNLIADYVLLFSRYSNRFPKIDKDQATQLVSQPDRALEFIETVPFSAQHKWELLQFCNNPQKMKTELATLLTWYWENIFKPESTRIEKLLAKYEKDLKAKLEKYGREYFQLLLMNNRRRKREISLGLTYFGELGYNIMFNEVEDKEFYLLGYRHMDVFVERKHGLLSNVLVFKALADETRQNMIKLLAEKEWYGDELAQKMGLSNSTVSYHLNILLLEGFIKLKRVDNRTYVSLNIKHLKKSIQTAMERMTR